MFESLAFAMGAPQAGGGAGGPADMLVQFIPLILMFAIFYFLLIRPQQKRAKEHKAMLAALKRGDYVVTGSGLLGRIMEIDEDTVVIECAESRLRMTRGAIAGMVDKSGKPLSAAPAPEAKNDGK
ncbi:MAG: preprotein translocase subunit YajC [Desulfovibrionaceae bacterium]